MTKRSFKFASEVPRGADRACGDIVLNKRSGGGTAHRNKYLAHAWKRERSNEGPHARATPCRRFGLKTTRCHTRKDKSESLVLITTIASACRHRQWPRKASSFGALRDRAKWSPPLTTTTTNRHLDIEYGMNIPQDSILNEDDRGLRGYGMFQLSGLNRYPNEGLATENYALTNNGVSLTLGLQHSDGLSLSGSPQPYLQGGHGHMDMVMRRQDGVLNASNFYGIHDVATGNNSGQWQLPRGGFNSSR